MHVRELEKLDKVAQTTLGLLAKEEEISEGSLSLHLKQARAAAEIGKRKVAFKYNKLQVELAASSIKEYVTLAVRIALRASMATQGVINKLPGEIVICASDSKSAEFKCKESMGLKANSCRLRLFHLLSLEDQSEQTGEKILVPSWAQSSQKNNVHRNLVSHWSVRHQKLLHSLIQRPRPAV
eukprot:6467623-Amphidinium_carterae.4